MKQKLKDIGKPIIAIVIAINKHSKDLMAVESRYMHLIESSGGIPVLFPVYREGLIPHNKLITMADGILLTGSYILKDSTVHKKMLKTSVSLRDINPVYYDYCLKLIKLARLNKKPVIGICRGMQLLAEEDGGEVKMRNDIKSKINHKQNSHPSKLQHNIKTVKSSLISYYCGGDIQVNSFHQQSIIKFPKKYIVTAFSEDSIPEVIEYQNIEKWFSVGFQFHPEWLFEKNKGLLRIFKLFIKKSDKS